MEQIFCPALRFKKKNLLKSKTDKNEEKEIHSPGMTLVNPNISISNQLIKVAQRVNKRMSKIKLTIY
jgi:hypothetical protein